MKTVNKITRNSKAKSNWFLVIFIILLALVTALIMNHFEYEKRFSVVKFGDGDAVNISKNYNFIGFSPGYKYKGSLLAEEGDLLAINNTFIYFKNTQDDSMQVNDEGDSLVFVNGNINSIIISGNENLLPWFRTMKAATIEDLQSIHFSSKIPASYVPFLKEIARLKPNTALIFKQKDSADVLDDYLKQADYFTPRFIQASVPQSKIPLLSHWKSIECLYLVIPDSNVTVPIPAMPALKQCILYGDNLTDITASFFSNNTQLEKVTLIANVTDHTLLQPLNKLQEISLFNGEDYSTDIAALKNKFSKLSVLTLSGRYSNIDLLASFKNLRWLGLPKNTSQQQFNTIAAALQNLQVLELNGSDSIASLAALQQLHKLKGLVITDTVTDKQSLYTLQELKYLSVQNENEADSIYLLALEKALPGCIVVPNSGACLGSGWLLLMIPMVLLLLLFLNKGHLKRNSYETS